MKMKGSNLFFLQVVAACSLSAIQSEAIISNPKKLSAKDQKHALNFAMLEKGYEGCDANAERYVVGSCSATRIAKDLFVTARHCLVDAKSRFMVTDYARWSDFLKQYDVPHHSKGKCMDAVLLEDWAANEENGAIDVVAEYAAIPNKDVNLDNRSDVAILQIAEKDIKRIEQEIVPIVPEPLSVGDEVFVIGFGAAECIDNAGDFMGSKPYVQNAEKFSAGKGFFEVIPFDSLPGKMAVFYDKLYDHGGTILASTQGEQYICAGDSGAGIFTKDEEKNYRLHGVVASYYFANDTDPAELRFPGMALSGPALGNQPFCDMIKKNSLRRPELEFCF